jgi:hypothetical protein
VHVTPLPVINGVVKCEHTTRRSFIHSSTESTRRMLRGVHVQRMMGIVSMRGAAAGVLVVWKPVAGWHG